MAPISGIKWQYKKFIVLTAEELYSILQLRNEVFVVEQNCVYQDCDDKDKQSIHLSGYLHGKLVAYARLLPVGISYAAGASIGRIVTSPAVRGKNVGRELMRIALKTSGELFGPTAIIISAQAHLKLFYEEFGFIAEGKKYLEDGIPHLQMKKLPA